MPPHTHTLLRALEEQIEDLVLFRAEALATAAEHDAIAAALTQALDQESDPFTRYVLYGATVPVARRAALARRRALAAANNAEHYAGRLAAVPLAP